MKQRVFQLVILLAGAGLAHADTVYTSFAAWSAAVSGINTVNFEGIAPANPGYVSVGPSDVVGGLTFSDGPSSPNSALFVIDDAFYGFGVATMSAQGPGSGVPFNDLLVTLPSPVTAVAFDFFISPGIATATLSDSFTQPVVSTSQPPTSIFLGFTAPGGISSVDLTMPWTLATASIDMADFSTASAGVPEPATFLLFTPVVLLFRKRRA